MSMISKTATKQEAYLRKSIYFDSARSGFRYILSKVPQDNSIVLLPSYIGISPKEGSGIFDPVRESNLSYEFYAMTGDLSINVADFEAVINSANSSYKHIIVLLVHYFGFVDKSIEQVCKLSREAGAVIVEDEAHALYTDYIDGMCGEYGDYSIFSLHKMLPYAHGGMLRINNSLNCLGVIEGNNKPSVAGLDIAQYDLASISKKRKLLAEKIYSELLGFRGLHFLHRCPVNITPQTIPIILSPDIRNDFYFHMNEKGFGIVSLYHTLIPEIDNEKYHDVILLSKSITNLPVHQDAEVDGIEKMCEEIKMFMDK